VVSCGQLRSVEVSCGQLRSVAVSCGQLWSVAVSGRLTSVTGRECVSDAELMFVMATGAEMDPYYMPRVIEFITNLTTSLPVNSGKVRIGVITYGLRPRLDIALGQFSLAEDIIAALSNLTYHGTRRVIAPLTTDRSRDVAMATNFRVKMSEIGRLIFIRCLGIPKLMEYRNFDFHGSVWMIWLHRVKI